MMGCTPEPLLAGMALAFCLAFAVIGLVGVTCHVWRQWNVWRSLGGREDGGKR